MEMKVYSIFDTKAKAYLQPFHAVNSAVATRMVSDAANQPDHMFNKHAADYVLFEIASFDDDNGVFSGLKGGPVNLGNLLSFIVPPNPIGKERL